MPFEWMNEMAFSNYLKKYRQTSGEKDPSTAYSKSSPISASSSTIYEIGICLNDFIFRQVADYLWSKIFSMYGLPVSY